MIRRHDRVLLDGAAAARAIKDELRAEVEALRRGGAPRPGRAAGRRDPASAVYVRNKTRACDELGLHHETARLPASATTAEVLAQGRGVQPRAPTSTASWSSSRCRRRSTPSACSRWSIRRKDVDGFHPENVGLLVQKRPRFVACTPAGIMELLERAAASRWRAGARWCWAAATSWASRWRCCCCTPTPPSPSATRARRDLAAVTREADILVAAIGRAGLVRAEHVKPGAVVIDVGMNRVDDADAAARPARRAARLDEFERKGYALVGDVHAPSVREVASALTPVPGGVGPLTIAMLMKNTVRAAAAAALPCSASASPAASRAASPTCCAASRRAGLRTLDLDARGARGHGARAAAPMPTSWPRSGPASSAADGAIDRRRWAPSSSPTPRRGARLNAIVHPRVREEEARRARRSRGGAGTRASSPTPRSWWRPASHLRFDRLVVVHCAPEEQLAPAAWSATASTRTRGARAHRRADAGRGEARASRTSQVDTSGTLRDGPTPRPTPGRRAAARSRRRVRRATRPARARARARWCTVRQRTRAASIASRRAARYRCRGRGLEMERVARAARAAAAPGPWYRAARSGGATPARRRSPAARRRSGRSSRGGPDAEFAGRGRRVAGAAHAPRGAAARAAPCLLALALQAIAVARFDGRGGGIGGAGRPVGGRGGAGRALRAGVAARHARGREGARDAAAAAGRARARGGARGDRPQGGAPEPRPRSSMPCAALERCARSLGACEHVLLLGGRLSARRRRGRAAPPRTCSTRGSAGSARACRPPGSGRRCRCGVA